jgi:nitrogen fixation/metabolism regulation signal transduction histidine kinase
VIKEQAARNRLQMIMITMLSVAGVIAISIMLSLSITKPLRRLTDGALAMSRGQLEQSIEVTSGTRLGNWQPTSTRWPGPLPSWTR